MSKLFHPIRTLIRGILLIGLIVATIFVVNYKQSQKNITTKTPEILTYETVNLNNVIDGDTLSITATNGKVYSVRLIGIDTPESKHPDANRNTKYGTIASNYTKDLLNGQTQIELNYDTEQFDQYDRLLAYVYYTKDNQKISLNEQLLIDGFAKDIAYKPNVKYATKFHNLCETAKKQGIGLWQYADFEFQP